jgi:hypothetical protein
VSIRHENLSKVASFPRGREIRKGYNIPFISAKAIRKTKNIGIYIPHEHNK